MVGGGVSPLGCWRGFGEGSALRDVRGSLGVFAPRDPGEGLGGVNPAGPPPRDDLGGSSL